MSRLTRPPLGTPFDQGITSAWLAAHADDAPVPFDSEAQHVDLINMLEAALETLFTDITALIPSGGGSSGAYAVRQTADVALASAPAADTLIPGLSLVLPASSATRSVAVSFAAYYYSNHAMRAKVFLDGAVVWPTGGAMLDGVVSSLNDATPVNGWTLTASGIVLPIPGDDAAHTLEVRWNAMTMLNGLTLKDRSLVALVVG